MIYSFLLAIPFLAFEYRARGGAIVVGSDTLARILFWAWPCGLVCEGIAYTHHLPLWLGIPCAVMAFAGSCIGHSSEQSTTFLDHIEMGIITFLMLLLMIAPMAYFEPTMLFYAPLGYLGAAAYAIGYNVTWTLKIGSTVWCHPKGTEYGEFLTGALAFGLPLAIIGII